MVYEAELVQVLRKAGHGASHFANSAVTSPSHGRVVRTFSKTDVSNDTSGACTWVVVAAIALTVDGVSSMLLHDILQ